ncbi:MAG: hypothetical protein H7235_09400 [Bdellovibrionaceae bacterium]|nr:hypothetical protein [Pseudobdellovibrionaceae bacterium]
MIRFIFSLFLLISTKSYGYPNFIGHSYTSCMNCHYNPLGGGQINDYGRAVAATAISSKVLFPNSWTEEKFADFSGFLFQKEKQNWLRTQINYRGLELTTNPAGSREKKQWINMQSDVRATLLFGDNDQLIVSGDYGVTPPPKSGAPGKSYEAQRSRSHYIGYRPSPSYGIYAGLMDTAYGLRVVEHTAFSRITTQTSQNDQTHGIMGHYIGDLWETGVHLFAGNLAQDGDLRMKGASAITERTVSEIHRLGASIKSAKNDYLNLTSLAVHGRFNLKEGSALLAEFGQVDKKTKNGSDDKVSQYALVQTYLRPTRGLYVLTNIEYLKTDSGAADSTIRWGPGVQIFPAPKLEMRADIYNTRSLNSGASVADSWMFLYQVHVWL